MTDARSAASLSEAYRKEPVESGDSFRATRAAREARGSVAEATDWLEPDESPPGRGPWLTWVIAGLVLATGIGIAVVLANNRDDGAATGSTATTQADGLGATTARPAPSTSAPDTKAKGGSAAPLTEVVKVVEQGWTVNDSQQSGSYAFVIQNSGNKVLGSFLVRVKAWDRAGKVISGLADWKYVIGTMQPGQRLGIAAALDTPDVADNGISRLQATVAELSSDPLHGARPPAKVPAGTVKVHGVSRQSDGADTTVSYDAESTFTTPLEADAYVLLRDAKGSLLGGTASFVDLPARGPVRGDFSIRNDIVSDDVATAEVYVVPRLPMS